MSRNEGMRVTNFQELGRLFDVSVRPPIDLAQERRNQFASGSIINKLHFALNAKFKGDNQAATMYRTATKEALQSSKDEQRKYGIRTIVYLPADALGNMYVPDSNYTIQFAFPYGQNIQFLSTTRVHLQNEFSNEGMFDPAALQAIDHLVAANAEHFPETSNESYIRLVGDIKNVDSAIKIEKSSTPDRINGSMALDKKQGAFEIRQMTSVSERENAKKHELIIQYFDAVQVLMTEYPNIQPVYSVGPGSDGLHSTLRMSTPRMTNHIARLMNPTIDAELEDGVKISETNINIATIQLSRGHFMKGIDTPENRRAFTLCTKLGI